MVIICLVSDEAGSTTTMNLLVESTTGFEGSFDSESQPITVKIPQSKITSEWMLTGSRQIKII